MSAGQRSPLIAAEPLLPCGDTGDEEPKLSSVPHLHEAGWPLQDTRSGLMAAQSPLDRGRVTAGAQNASTTPLLSPTLHPPPPPLYTQAHYLLNKSLKMDLKRPEKKPWVPGHPTFRTERPISLLEYWYGHYYFKKPLLSAIQHPDANELC